MTTGEAPYQRPPELDDVTVYYNEGSRWITCFCKTAVRRSIVPHLKTDHPDRWTEWVSNFVRLRGAGYPLKRIMREFSDRDGTLLFSWTVVERAVRDAVESGIQIYSPPRKIAIGAWTPKEFKLEAGTIWDFPRRGDWAVHKGDYRGNWPPQLARNLIERFSAEGDLIVDLFVGGGTTLVEAWLLRRKSLGLDVSTLAVQTTRGRLDEMGDAAQLSNEICLHPEFRPHVIQGSALKFRKVASGILSSLGSVSLICVHPPYLNALRYTKDNKDDFSRIRDPHEFSKRMRLLAQEIYLALPPGGTCAILMGDVRQSGKLIPLGYNTLNQFERSGFALQDIVIKRQHHDRSSEFYTKSDKQLLLSHEYLFILNRPESG